MSRSVPSSCSVLPSTVMTLPFAGRVGELSWQVVSRDRVVMVHLDGDLDAYTAPSLDERVRPLLEIGAHVVVELATLRFCGCAGLILLQRWRRSAIASGGSLHLAAVSRTARRAISVSGLGNTLPLMVDSVDMAEVVCTVSVRHEESG